MSQHYDHRGAASIPEEKAPRRVIESKVWQVPNPSRRGSRLSKHDTAGSFCPIREGCPCSRFYLRSGTRHSPTRSSSTGTECWPKPTSIFPRSATAISRGDASPCSNTAVSSRKKPDWNSQRISTTWRCAVPKAPNRSRARQNCWTGSTTGASRGLWSPGTAGIPSTWPPGVPGSACRGSS